MSSERKIQPNRRNALKSTGPKSEEGKNRVGENAVTHGLTSQKAVLRGEDPAEYEKLRMDVFARCQPVGAMEECMALQMVSYIWQFDRLHRVQGAFFNHLARQAAGRRAIDIGLTGQIIGGKLHMFEKEKEAFRFEAAKDVELTSEDIENALAASVMEPDAMKANRLIDAKGHAFLRGYKRCRKELDAMQELRQEKEEMDLLNEPPPPIPFRNRQRRNIAQED